MILKLAYKNVISRRSSIVIILFVSFAVCLFCVANALFDSTEQGVQTNYVSSFTGDLIIRPTGGFQLSLFGDETPITGELTELPRAVPYTDLIEYITSQDNVKAAVGQVSGMAAIEHGSNRYASYVFGVNGQEYARMMTSIHILEGQPYEPGQKGVMLCTNAVQKLGVKLGDTVQFVVTDGPYVRIRAAPLTAIFEYEIHSEIFDRFAIVDPDTVRSLLDMTDTMDQQEVYIDEENMNLIDMDMDIDSLFDDAGDTEFFFDETWEDDLVDFEEIEDLSATQASTYAEPQPYISSNSWNFIIVRLAPGTKADKVIKKFNRYFKRKAWPVQAVDWRHAAGSTALYLYWMRIIFNIGITIVLFAGFIIVNNTLIINVLDRTQEIGTMRAVGAKKRFISLECMAETFMMTLSSGVIGVLAGIWGCRLITKANIIFHNSFLIQLFGSDALTIFVTGGNIAKMFLLVVVLGIIGWIYPVITAVKVSPVTAMQGAR